MKAILCGNGSRIGLLFMDLASLFAEKNIHENKAGKKVKPLSLRELGSFANSALPF
jgi:hypothetical protein